MIEVFKTNVSNKDQAAILIRALKKFFPSYTGNFDLDDCDKVLRVESSDGPVYAFEVIDFLRDLSFQAEVLPDDDNDAQALNRYEAMIRCLIQN
jgi:hypothetical protein